MIRSIGRRAVLAAVAVVALAPTSVVIATPAAAAPPLYSVWVKYSWSPCVYDVWSGTAKWVSPAAYNQAGRPVVANVLRIAGDKIVRNVTRSDEVFVISPPVTSSGAPGDCGSWHHMTREEWDLAHNPAAISTGRRFTYDCNMVSGPVYVQNPGEPYISHLTRDSWQYYGYPTPESPKCTFP